MAGSNTIGAVMFSAFTAMLKIAIIALVGIFSARYPKKDPILSVSSLRHMARLSSLILLPALTIFSLGSGVSSAMLSKIGVLVLFSLVSNALGYGLVRAFGRYVFEKGNENLFIAVQVAVGCPNSMSLPILTMETLCEDRRFNIDFNGDSEQCSTESTAMIFVYCIGWHVVYWSYGYPLLKTIGIVDQNVTPEALSLAQVQKSLKAFLNEWDMTDKIKRKDTLVAISAVVLTPCIIAILIGVVIALIPPLQHILFTPGAPLRFIGSAIETIGIPVNSLNCIIMAASLAHCDLSAFTKMFHTGMDNFLFKIAPSDKEHGTFQMVESVNAMHQQQQTVVDAEGGVPETSELDISDTQSLEEKILESDPAVEKLSAPQALPKWNSTMCFLFSRYY